MYRKKVVPDQQVKNLNSKAEADLTDEQRKKVGIILGRLEGMIKITVSLQDVWRKEHRQNKRKWDIKKWRKTMQKVGPSLKVTPLFSHYTYSAYPRVSKGYYNGLLPKQWLWNT